MRGCVRDLSVGSVLPADDWRQHTHSLKKWPGVAAQKLSDELQWMSQQQRLGLHGKMKWWKYSKYKVNFKCAGAAAFNWQHTMSTSHSGTWTHFWTHQTPSSDAWQTSDDLLIMIKEQSDQFIVFLKEDVQLSLSCLKAGQWDASLHLTAAHAAFTALNIY